MDLMLFLRFFLAVLAIFTIVVIIITYHADDEDYSDREAEDWG